MNILGFDTCFDACSVALECGGEGCVASRFEPMATGHAERLVLMISEVMAEAGLPFDAVDRLAVTCGPGTFTGTRIAVAAARALALATGKPLVAATSLWVMAEEVAESLKHSDEDSPDILVATDARRGEVYVQHFRAGAPLCDAAVLSPQAAADLLSHGGPAVVAGSGAIAVADAAGTRDGSSNLRALRRDLVPDARFLARLAVRLDDNGRSVSPLYLRPADAKPQTGKSMLRVTP